MATTKDPVGAARKNLEAMKAAVVAEGRRLAAAIEKADRFGEEAASIDPDTDAKGFEKATAQLGSLRATVEILRTREASATGKAEAALAALAAAELADKRARLAALEETIRARDAAAIERARGFAIATHEDVSAVIAAAQAADALDREIQGGGTVRSRVGLRGVPLARGGASDPRRTFARLAQLEAEGAL